MFTLGYIFFLLFDNFFIFLTDICFLTRRFFLSCRWKLFKLFSSLLVNFQKKFSNKIQNSFSLFHAYKIFSPWTRKIKPIFKRKPNRNQKKNLKIQTKTQPQTETKFSKTKPKPSQEISKLNPKFRKNPTEKKIN